MLTPRIIPCLDVRDGRIVKGVRFANLRDAGDPAEQARQYAEQGADELIMLDVSATPEGRATSAPTVEAIRAVISIPLTVGGGVGTVEHAATLLDAGADKVAVNTAAVRTPSLIEGLSSRFGRQCIVVAIDAVATAPSAPPRAGWRVIARSGTEQTDLDAVEWARRAASLGAGEILLTSFDRDGTRSGYDLPLIEAIASEVRIPVIASGGADSALHMLDALRAGADGLLAASIFHDGDATVGDVKRFLIENNVEVRL